MTNPTRQQIIDAHEALDTLCRETGVKTPVNALKWIILKALPPKPKPTMNEIEWDDDEHFLAEAENPELGKVVMLRKTESGLIEFTIKPYTAFTKGSAWPEYLTPTGKRYTLTEVQE